VEKRNNKNMQVLNVKPLEAPEEQEEIQIVSDGGVHELQGSFGVVITKENETITTNKRKLYSTDFHQSLPTDRNCMGC
jgi:hypothetical protein